MKLKWKIHNINETETLVSDAEPSEQEEKGRSFSIGYILSSALLIFAVSICALVSAQIMTKGHVSIAGFSLFRVVTGSMEPTIPTGAILISKKTNIHDIQSGDIVCFRSEMSMIRGQIVTHRVVAIGTDEYGNRYLQTKGDANLVTDIHLVNADNLMGRVVYHSGEKNIFTNMLSFLNGKIGFLSCIVFPILLVAGLILQNSIASLRKEMNQINSEIEKENSDPLPEQDILSGYSSLTKEDYDDILNAVKGQLLKESQEHALEDAETTEYHEAEQ